MSRRLHLKPIKLNAAVTSSIHENVSQGYVNISPEGERTFVPYNTNEMGEIHSFISPSIRQYRHMKWTKTHDWKDKDKAKKSKWKYTKVHKGMNTGPR